MARMKKTNKVKNKAAVKKTTAKKKTVKKTAKKKTVAKRGATPTPPAPLEAPLYKDKDKNLGYFELNVGEGRIIDISLRRYLSDIKKVKSSGEFVKIHEWAVDRTESLIKIFKNALKKS